MNWLILSDIKLLIVNWKKAIDWLKTTQKQEDESRELYDALQQYGIYADRGGNPTKDIGAALRLSEEYHIRLEVGLCYGDCRAVLDKTIWKHEISPTADPWSYSLFTRLDPKTVTRIQAIDKSPCRAICECLLHAKRAGVI